MAGHPVRNPDVGFTGVTNLGTVAPGNDCAGNGCAPSTWRRRSAERDSTPTRKPSCCNRRRQVGVDSVERSVVIRCVPSPTWSKDVIDETNPGSDSRETSGVGEVDNEFASPSSLSVLAAWGKRDAGHGVAPLCWYRTIGG